MDKIIPSFKKSLFSGSKSIIADLSELGIDSLLDKEIVKDIPIISLFIGVKNTVQNIYGRNALIQILKFINEFNSGTIDEAKLEEYRRKINDDPKKAEKELGKIIIILSNNTESIILANFYRNYINGYISWDEFCELSEVLNLLFINDIKILEKIQNKKLAENEESKLYQINRLEAFGLINRNIAVWNKNNLEITELGEKLLKYKNLS